MKYYFFPCVILLFSFTAASFSQELKVLESNSDFIRVQIDFSSGYTVRDSVLNNYSYKLISGKDPVIRNNGEPYLPDFYFSIGIPHESSPTAYLKIISSERQENVHILPYYSMPEGTIVPQQEFAEDRYINNSFFPEKSVNLQESFIVRYAKILPVAVSPYQYNPVSRELIFNKKVEVKINYNQTRSGFTVPVQDTFCDEFLNSNVINAGIAKTWTAKQVFYSSASLDTFWYNPQSDYYKLFLKQKGVYRLTYDYLVNAGMPVTNININKFQLYNEGQPVPVEIVDNGDSLFNTGDYIQFVGLPPKSSPNTYFNLYNNSNVYWLTYEFNNDPLRYSDQNGYPENWISTIQTTKETLHYEADSLFERLGYAPGSNRDYWFWGTSSGMDGNPTRVFSQPFNSMESWNPDSMRITIRAGLQGMTNGPVYPDHHVRVELTSQLVDSINWDGQNDIVFEKTVTAGQDLQIYPINNFQVIADGKVPRNPLEPGSTPVDEIRINWFEIDYWRAHQVVGENFIFKNTSGFFGANTYSVFRWNADNMKIFIPSKGAVIRNPRILNNTYQEVLFRDTTYEFTEYFLVSSNSFLTPDSIKKNIPSDLRNTSNGADYIIISHKDFMEAAGRLAAHRSGNLKGFTNPRVKVVDVDHIYNEFSAGLLNPFALRDFVKYAFENWTSPAPRYIVLMGDMSYDYRKLLQSSRPNFIPSIPFLQSVYGQAVADNNIVTVAGPDVIPDLAIGRISCETMNEANILVDKIINYPADQGKYWKENVLLIGAGQSNSDENLFGFNDRNLELENSYIKPGGFTTTKVFRFPNKPEHFPFQGEGPQIRKSFNDGAVVANFFGHGGGYQWDLVFLNDDIYLLENGNRLPFITSVTCYTAHFDNQDVFGEQFNKVPGKGSIGFWGSTGLTFWDPALSINRKVYNQIFGNYNYVIGDAILMAKIESANSYSLILEHIALLTLLGDPGLELALPQKPDFAITNQDIKITPEFPIAEDSLTIRLNIRNFGKVFPGDSVMISLKAEHGDSTEIVGIKYIQNFGEYDSVSFSYVPLYSGQYRFVASVNEDQGIEETDYSDNNASVLIYLYNLKEPSIIKPGNGMAVIEGNAEILISDVGHYINKIITYHIQMDTSTEFTYPLINDSTIISDDGLISYKVNLPAGKYFWRVRLVNDNVVSKWTDTRTMSIGTDFNPGFMISGKGLKVLGQENTFYYDSLSALVINTSFLPPKPDTSRWNGTVNISKPPDLASLSASTTDGQFIYYAHMAYYGGPSKIYKVGTGRMGSIKGEDYGYIPGVEVNLWHTMFYYDGYIYAATGDAYSLLKIHPMTGDTSRITLPEGMIDESARVKNGAFYLNSDGRYVYNLAHIDSLGNFRYTLRILDPQNGWAPAAPDKRLSGTSYPNFVSFFAADGNIYVYENAYLGYMRRINIETGIYEEEWVTFYPYRSFYSWTFDWTNNIVFSSVYQGTLPGFYEYIGRYKKSSGIIRSNEIGPAEEWSALSYEIERTQASTRYNFTLFGQNQLTGRWDTLMVNPSPEQSLGSVDPSVHKYLRAEISLTDTSLSQLYPIRLKKLNVSYTPPPEILVSQKNFTYSPDSVLQGFETTMRTMISNKGYSQSDSISASFYLNNSDSSFYQTQFSLLPDSNKTIEYVIPTASLLPATVHEVKVDVEIKKPDFFNFNNNTKKSFFVARDSIQPLFKFTIDGRELIPGDIISAKPEIKFSLRDDGPLPLKKEDFTIVYNNIQMKLDTTAGMEYSYTPYPNSEAIITWNPQLKDGKHTLEILAKDPSGNFFDSTSYKAVFYVFNQFDVLNIYNYPNPFVNETHFTFELRGDDKKMEECRILVYTLAGRLIRKIEVDPAQLRAGFNRIPWDGRDEDGDEIANGIYLYKMITRNEGITKTHIQKLAKIK